MQSIARMVFSNAWSALCAGLLLRFHIQNTNIMHNVYSCTIDCTHSTILSIFLSSPARSSYSRSSPNLPTYTKNVKPNALATLSPTTVHPVLITCLLLNWRPVSHTKCLIPFMVWKVKGSAKNAFNPIFATGDMLATAAAMLADSRCQPSSGATR
jgi:hypothetical protein